MDQSAYLRSLPFLRSVTLSDTEVAALQLAFDGLCSFILLTETGSASASAAETETISDDLKYRNASAIAFRSTDSAAAAPRSVMAYRMFCRDKPAGLIVSFDSVYYDLDYTLIRAGVVPVAPPAATASSSAAAAMSDGASGGSGASGDSANASVTPIAVFQFDSVALRFWLPPSAPVANAALSRSSQHRTALEAAVVQLMASVERTAAAAATATNNSNAPPSISAADVASRIDLCRSATAQFIGLIEPAIATHNFHKRATAIAAPLQPHSGGGGSVLDHCAHAFSCQSLTAPQQRAMYERLEAERNALNAESETVFNHLFPPHPPSAAAAAGDAGVAMTDSKHTPAATATAKPTSAAERDRFSARLESIQHRTNEFSRAILQLELIPVSNSNAIS